MRLCVAALLVALMALTGCAKRTVPPPPAPPSTSGGLRSTRPAGSYDVTSEPPKVNHTLDAEFGPIRLVGMNVPDTIRRGEPFDIGLSWLCLSKPGGDWTIAMHIDHQGQPSRRVNSDHQPPLPTSQWEVGKYTSWSHPFTFTEDMPTGTYVISVYPYATAGTPVRVTKIGQSGGSTEPSVKITVQ
jgi:hypothetical protein